LIGWDLNPRAQLINTPNTDIIYLLSKGTDMEREELLMSYPLHFPNQSPLRGVSAIHISLPLKCQLAYNYHDFATLTLVYSIYDSTEEAI
jgi:hypothetical protein